MTSLVDRIRSIASELGFETVGITSLEPFEWDERAHLEWCESGYAADMKYMLRANLLARPRRLAPFATSLLTLAVNYYSEAPAFHHANRYGRVARYAWGRDYHDVVKRRLTEFVHRIEDEVGTPIQHRVFVDAVPLLERAAAARAGIGFFGKNTNLLIPGFGSWFFLAEVLIDLDLPPEDRRVSVSCGRCSRCLSACPTGAFVGPYRLDSRRCISYLTIENRGAIPRELRAGLGEWIFGCDICQEMEAGSRGALPVIVRGEMELVCPFNRFARRTSWPELRPEAGTGPRLDLVEVLSIETQEEFRERFKGTALLRAKRGGLLRNAAVVAANVRCTNAIPVLINRIDEESDPLIRSHALWSLAQLEPPEASKRLDRFLIDSEPLVREEAAHLKES